MSSGRESDERPCAQSSPGQSNYRLQTILAASIKGKGLQAGNSQPERRDELEEIKQGCESTKVQLRNARRDANDACKKLRKDNVITEDDEKDILKDIDKSLADFIAKVDKICKDKETEVTSV